MLVFCDSFHPYNGNSGWMAQRWTQLSGVAPGAFGVAGRSGVNLGSNGGMNKTLAPSATSVVGFRYQINLAGPGFGGVIFSWSAVAVGRTIQQLLQLAVLPDGTFAVYAGTSVLIMNPTAFVFTSGLPYYVELKTELSGSGTAQVNVTATLRVNGVQIGTGSQNSGTTCNSLLSGLAQANFYTWGVGTPGGTNLVSDLYVLDESGATNNTFLGDVAVGAIYPISDGTLVGFTPSTGITAFNMLNEMPPDADATYIGSHGIGDEAECFFQTVASFTGQILGVQFSVVARKDDEGIRAFRHAVGAAAAYVDTSDTYLADGYRYYHVPFDVDPTGPTPWTVPGINAQQFGVKTTV